MNIIHDDTQIVGFFEDYRWLSNFWSSWISYGGLMYATNEHFFQAMKSTDPNYRFAVASADTAGKAKRLGSRAGMEKLGVELRPDWETIKVEVMRTGLRMKFANEPLRSKLMATKGKKLVEENNWGDKFWGTCDGDGLNVLGMLLQEVRGELTTIN